MDPKNCSSDALTAVHEHLMRIESAYYYSPGDGMSQVHPVKGTVSPRRVNGTRLVCIVSGNGNRPLAEAVALLLGVPTHHTLVTQRESGEVNVCICESVLGADVYIIQSTTGNELIDVNTSVMELLLLIRKMRLSNAKRITAVIPSFAYSRQDSKTSARSTIPASAVAEMLTKMGVDRITTLDLHSGQIQGFFGNTPLDNLQMYQEFAQYISGRPWFDPDNMVIVSVGAGNVDRASRLADTLRVGRIVTIVKRCSAAGVETLQTVGEVTGHVCVIVDSVCDTGEVLVKSCELLKSLGATKIIACCTHGILTPPCSQWVNACDALSELVVSDSIPQEEHKRVIPKLKVLTIAPLLATVVDKHTRDESIHALFDVSLPPMRKTGNVLHTTCKSLE